MKYAVSFLASLLFLGYAFAYNYVWSDGKGYDINTHYLEYANFLASQDMIVTHTNELQKYRLENTITRAELIWISLKVAGIALPNVYTCKNYYWDVSTNYPNNWACRAIEIAADNGIVTRENFYFRPNDNITKAEALWILMKAKNIQYERNIQKWWYKPGTPQWQIDILEWAIKNGIIFDYETYGVNAPAIRGEIFKQATKTLVAAWEAIDKKYNYLTFSGHVYHFGHRMPDVDAASFSLMEGDFFRTKVGVYKNFGCSVYSGCGEGTIVRVPVSLTSAMVIWYHFISDSTIVWNCESRRCIPVQTDAKKFTCLDSLRVCGDWERAFDLSGNQLYPDSNYNYRYNWVLPRIYAFFMFFKRFETAKELVSESAVPYHNTLVTRMQTGSYISSYVSNDSISFYGDSESLNVDVTVDQETAKLESIYIRE